MSSGFVFPAVALGLSALLVRPRRGFFPPDSPPIVAQVTIEERHHDELEITEHPVEQGAPIADHAFKRPSIVIVRAGWSNSPSSPGSLVGIAVGIGAAVGGRGVGILASVPSTITAAQSVLTGNSLDQVKGLYQQMLALQERRIPFDMLTGKRQYKNMLVKSLTAETDKETENCLILTIVCQQVIIVSTRIVTLGGGQIEDPEDPEETLPVEKEGTKSLVPGDNFTLDTGTLAGSLTDLNSGFSSVMSTLNLGTDTLSSMSGPLAQLPGVLSSASTSITSVLSQLPIPSEIPLVSGAQELLAPLSGFNLTGAVGDAMAGLPAVLNQAQSTLQASIQQFPAIVSELPSTMEHLKTQMQDVIPKFFPANGQLDRVLGRQ